MLRIAVYYRVSTDLQDTQLQRLAFDKWLSARPEPHLVTEFIDEGIGGSVANRPGYLALTAAVEARAVDVVVAFALDRLSRRGLDALYRVLHWNQLGVAFVSLSQPNVTTFNAGPEATLMLAAFASFGEMERAALSNRMKAFIKGYKAQHGRWGRLPSMTLEQRHLAAAKHAAGLSIRAIAKDIGQPYTVVQRALKINRKEIL